MKKCIANILALFVVLSVNAQNTTKSVEQVTTAVTVAVAVDYHITSAEPFGSSGNVNITHADGVVIFDAVKPSTIMSSYLSKIKINGVAAVNDENCRIGLYRNGTIVYPHVNSKYNPLTVYTQKNFAGEMQNNYLPFTFHRALGDFADNIRSFKLKRGYMVTMACNTDGTGYSRVFIAQDQDLEVADLGPRLSGKVGFLRILPWNPVSKKGSIYSPTNGQANIQKLKASWFENYWAGDITASDFESVVQQYQYTWPSISEFLALQNANTVFGYKMPEMDGVQTISFNYNVKEPTTGLDSLEYSIFHKGAWQQLYTLGMRVGAPSVMSDITWLDKFMSYAKKYNCRIDFIPISVSDRLTDAELAKIQHIHDTYKVPVWLFIDIGYFPSDLPDSDGSASAANQEYYKTKLSSVINKIEANSMIERYAVTPKRGTSDLFSDLVLSNGSLTLAGEWVAQLDSKMSYTDGENYVPSWVYYAPENITAKVSSVTKKATVEWVNLNGKQTDSVWVERKINDGDWMHVATVPMQQSESCKFTGDDLSGKVGIIYYRVKNFDSDGRTRLSAEASVSIGSSEGNDYMQFGKLVLSGTDIVSTDFATPFDTVPALFMSLPTNANSKVIPANCVETISAKKFSYRIFPWAYQGEGTEMANEETIGFMAMEQGNYEFDNILMEVGSAKVKSEEVQVNFKTPFPQGVIPVVIAELKPLLKSDPMIVRIWDITNTGFKAKAMYEEGAGKTITANQTMFYAAATPGQAQLADNQVLTVGRGTNDLYSSVFRTEHFTRVLYDSKGDSIGTDTLMLEDPILFGALQTLNFDGATVLRKVSDITATDENGNTRFIGARVKRCCDATETEAKNNPASADSFGWLTISRGTVATRAVHNEVAGELASMFSSTEGIISLTISGELNGTDILFLRQLPNLKELNIRDARIVAGGESYFEGETTVADVVGNGMFSYMPKLQYLSLPSQAKQIGKEVFAVESLLELHFNSKATVAADAFIKSDLPTNLLVHVPAGTECEYDGNVIVDGFAENITLTDATPLLCTKSFTAGRITYTRYFSKETVPHQPGGWETIILPFDVQTVISEEKGEIAPFNSGKTGVNPFMLAELKSNGFEVANEIKANVPYIIAMPNSTEYEQIFNISGNVSFISENAVVNHTSKAVKSVGNTFNLVPAYNNVAQSPSVYAVNNEVYDGMRPGSAFVSGLRNVNPFEAYATVVTTRGVMANKRYFMITEGEGATSINRLYDKINEDMEVESREGVICIKSGKPRTVGIYAPDGRLVRLVTLSEGMNTVDGLAQGIYFIGNKKVMIR